MSKKTWSQKSRFGYIHSKQSGWHWRNKVSGVIKWKDLPFEEVSVREEGWLSIDEVRYLLNRLHENIYIDTTSVIKGWFPQGFKYEIINGNPMIHRRNLEVVIQAFMSRLVLELPPEAAFIDDTPAEESDIIEEEEDSVQVVKVPEHPSQEDKLDAILRIVLQLQASVDQIDAKLQHRKFSQRYLTEEMEVSR